MSESVGDTIDVAAPVEAVFSVAAAIEDYPQWNSSIKAVEVLERDANGRALKVRMEVDAKFRTVAYTLEYDYGNAPGGFSWRLIEGDLRQLEGSYRFNEWDDGTEITYGLTIDPGFPVPKLIKRQAERIIVRSALEELKARVESGR